MHCGDQKIQHLERAVSLGIEGKDRHSVDCNNNLRNIPQQSDDLKNIPNGSSGLICLEIGSYCGYSAIKIASLFNSNRKDFLYCVGKYCDYYCTCCTYYLFFSSWRYWWYWTKILDIVDNFDFFYLISFPLFSSHTFPFLIFSPLLPFSSPLFSSHLFSSPHPFLLLPHSIHHSY